MIRKTKTKHNNNYNSNNNKTTTPFNEGLNEPQTLSQNRKVTHSVTEDTRTHYTHLEKTQHEKTFSTVVCNSEQHIIHIVNVSQDSICRHVCVQGLLKKLKIFCCCFYCAHTPTRSPSQNIQYVDCGKNHHCDLDLENSYQIQDTPAQGGAEYVWLQQQSTTFRIFDMYMPLHATRLNKVLHP